MDDDIRDMHAGLPWLADGYEACGRLVAGTLKKVPGIAGGWGTVIQ